MTNGFKPDQLLYGGDYNPEQWPPEIWREDVRLMQEAGVNFVSLGIFSWAKLQPGPDAAFNFGWLDEVMGLLHAGGIGINLATATASPPPWLFVQFPDARPVTWDGVRLEVGGRQLYCPSHQGFRSAVQTLVRAVAGRYSDHPALRLWHVNNEYGCHISECFCDLCGEQFRVWLRERYGDIATLNAAWGTAFWSQQYGEWAEIQPPRQAPTYANPAQQLDWRRFSSDNLLGLFELEVEVLREITPQVPVTTNFLGFLKNVDYVKWAGREDVVSLDAYPDPADPLGHVEAALQYDLVRSLGGGQRWLLMEQATSAVNWRTRNAPKRPGLMRLDSLQAVAHGASAVMYFQWRASRAGAEKYHSGMLPHVGEKSRTWQEVKALGAELRGLRPLAQMGVPTRVALLFNWENWWALEIDSKPSADLRQMPIVLKYYAALRSLGQSVDLVWPEGDLSGYDAVIVPNAYLLTAGAAGNLRAFVQRGGHLVLGAFSGIVDEHEQIGLGGYPAMLRDVLGAWVEEWLPLAPGATLGVRREDGQETQTRTWAEKLHLSGAQALAHFTGDYLAGGAAISEHAFGQGRAYYLAADFEREDIAWVLRRALLAAGVAVSDLPLELDVGVSSSQDSHVLTLLNFHRTETLHLQLPEGGHELGGAGNVAPRLDLAPLEARFVRYDRPVAPSDVHVVTSELAPV
ncbi:beta-galactosidase [Deinococcus marmoris]|uniref:beta-galactosidase n=1 Tax=Deinococcus marmoris TaxID=249408 RepID=UPI0009DF98F4|nr:beta-galactosidase [Deinococcus marmoris]